MNTGIENKKDQYDRKLPMKVRIGFGIANLGDTVITEFVGAFLLFFFTNIAGIRPSVGGMIVAIGVLWDAVSDPVIGTLSDRSKFKAGRRRPFLLMAVLPIIISTALLFTAVNLSDGLKIAYFILMLIFYWTAYTLFNIPYLSLGSELTTNNDEKTTISSIRQVFGTIGLLFSNALPLILVSIFKGIGFSEVRSWTFAAATLGTIAGLAVLITWRATRGWEIQYENSEVKESVFKSLGKVLKYKPYILIIVASFFFYSAFNICNSTIIYNAMAVIGVEEAATASVYTIATVIGVILSIVIGKLAIKFDKKWVFVSFMAFAGASLCCFKIIGFPNINYQIIQFTLAHFGIISFLVLSYNLLYDTCEVYEFKTGQVMTGVMVSYFSFFIKLGKATALQVVGLILERSGYNAELMVQPETAKNAIINMASIIPGGLMLVCALIIAVYPISRKRFREMQKAKELRNAGMEYSTEAFKEIL